MAAVAAGFVGAVLLAAAVAKIARPAPLPGLPRWVSNAVPVAELVVGALLLAGFGAAAVAAIVLLAGFTAWLLRQLGRGDRRPCNCFGQARGAPIGAWSLARNAVLLAAAVLALAGPDRSAAGWRAGGAALGLAFAAVEARHGGPDRVAP